jgi:hypothetical protein
VVFDKQITSCEDLLPAVINNGNEEEDKTEFAEKAAP